jgi:hypothetical protein
MSVLFRFNPSGMTRQQYDQVTQRLQGSGAWPPDGLQLHVLFGDEGDLKVSEVWKSEEQQRTFSAKLLPELEQAGVQLTGEPETFQVHELQQPQATG